MLRIAHMAVIVVALKSAMVSLVEAEIIFPNRENYNVMNSDVVTLSAEQTSGLSPFGPGVLIMHQEASWDGGPNPPGGFNELTINFNAVRNIKSIRMQEGFGLFGPTAAITETSNDGINWTPQANSTTNPNNSNTEIVLTNAANAQYLRITPTAMQTEGAAQNNRWLIRTLRVFGDTGSITTDENMDVVSSSAYTSSPGLTLSLNGASMTDTTLAEFVDDRQNNPLERQVIFGLGQNEGFTLAFNQSIEFDRFAFNYATSGTPDLSAEYIIETSPDGFNFTTVATGTGQMQGPNFLDLTNTTGTHLRFTYTSTTSGDNRISDFMVFEPAVIIPEPCSCLLLLCGIAAILPFARRNATRR